ncbi:MAG: FAD binding domain-containing protein [Syntrophobacteraceae bacterium]|nr:FAD binding domain-containing protein [Syntrophobacteraceae bacterium]
MKTFDHYDAHSLDEALGLLANRCGKARINAGGTDLLGLLKDGVLPRYPELIVNIKTIPGLGYIEEDGERLRIGALARLCELAGSKLLRERYAVLCEAAGAVAGPQIRNVATVGGNLCQDVRCWYYRYPAHLGGTMECARKGRGPCFAIKGDNRYHAILGGRKCFAVCPSDLAVAFAALGGQMTIVSPRGERKIAVGDFYSPLGNGLADDEIVKEIDVAKAFGPGRQRFLKFTVRKPIDFAIVSVAAVTEEKNGVFANARIAIGGVAPGPFRAEKAEEKLIGKKPSEALAAEAAEAAVEGARPLSKNGWKIEVAKALITRVIGS